MVQWLRALWDSVAAHQLCDFGTSPPQTLSACPSSLVPPPLCAQQALCVDSINAQLPSECSCWIHGGASRWEEVPAGGKRERRVFELVAGSLGGWLCPSHL